MQTFYEAATYTKGQFLAIGAHDLYLAFFQRGNNSGVVFQHLKLTICTGYFDGFDVAGKNFLFRTEYD